MNGRAKYVKSVPVNILWVGNEMVSIEFIKITKSVVKNAEISILISCSFKLSSESYSYVLNA